MPVEDVRELSLAVRGIAFGVGRSRRVLAAEIGLGNSELLALGLLYTNGSHTARALTDSLALTTGSVTALIDRLESAGYAARTPNPGDRRSVLISLTDTGRDAMTWVYESFEVTLRSSLQTLRADGLLDDLSPERLARILATIGSSLETTEVARTHV